MEEKTYKFVFINTSVKLVIEIAPLHEAIRLNNTILFYLVQDNERVPLMLTERNKGYILGFLEKTYTNAPQVNKLVSFFKRMQIGEYLYVYPAFRECEEFYDILQESLKYYNKHLGEKYVDEMMTIYAEKIKQAHTFLNSLKYEMLMRIPQKKKIYYGETNKKKRICIFCGGSLTAGNANFREDAHAISEALGNKTFIQCEECDNCNDFFAKEVEEDLCNYLWATRLRYGIKGKNGYPTFQIGNQFIRYIDAEQVDANWGLFEIVKGKIQTSFKGTVMLGQVDIRGKKKLDIKYIKNYKPLHVYKALVKYAIGLIDKTLLTHFESTISWLKEGDIVHPLPKVAVIDSTKILLEPELYLFIRKKDVSFLPYCYGELRVGDKIFVFIVPFCDNDSRDYTQEPDFRYFITECLTIYHQNCAFEDFSSIIETPLQLSLDLGNPIKIDKFCLDKE